MKKKSLEKRPSSMATLGVGVSAKHQHIQHQQKNLYDPRSSDRAVRYLEERKIVLDYEIHVFEIVSLLGMIISVVGILMKWKALCWFSLLLSFVNIGNFHINNEGKQIFSSIFIAAVGIFMCYTKDSTPMYD